MRVLEVQWSWVLSLVCEVALRQVLGVPSPTHVSKSQLLSLKKPLEYDLFMLIFYYLMQQNTGDLC